MVELNLHHFPREGGGERGGEKKTREGRRERKERKLSEVVMLPFPLNVMATMEGEK